MSQLDQNIVTGILAETRSGEPSIERPHGKRLVRQCLFILLLAVIFLVNPVVAQDDVLCEADQLPDMISGFFQITTTLGIAGLVVVWQADSLAEMFTVNPEQKRGLKQHKRTALKSAVILLVLGPLYSVAGSIMSLPLADCVNLAPW
ncbi:hypothetical protein ATJ93_4480 [Halopiger aswanensis]|uniref:Uncharacterized protein n=1 Tax=Halopiger aswanensis TaxID=148449 RepID=A0A419VXU4_9EURY|nr:hypothetical protein ATJ93_4480 [Halopiger aswanensis]